MHKRITFTGNAWEIKNHALIPKRVQIRMSLTDREAFLCQLVKAGAKKRMARTTKNLKK